ncbi:MAG: alternative ribosome rescue aminoacyl-tRNA hydrolase ArfB [Planctomycetota bacterium]|jgi:ribosome-associated protein
MTTNPPQPEPNETPSGTEIAPNVRVPDASLRLKYSRSGGPGGQNVNKRDTKAELRIALDDIPISDAATRRLERLAASRLVDDEDAGPTIQIISEEHRTQRQNRQACLDRLRELLVQALNPPKPRKKTKPTYGSKLRRLKAKKEHSEKKQRRQRPPD